MQIEFAWRLHQLESGGDGRQMQVFDQQVLSLARRSGPSCSGRLPFQDTNRRYLHHPSNSGSVFSHSGTGSSCSRRMYLCTTNDWYLPDPSTERRRAGEKMLEDW